MLGTLRLIFGLGLREGVRDGAGVLIDGRDGLGVNDLLRPNDGLDGCVGADLGLMDGLDRPGLMDGLGRLGVIERLELDPEDPRLLLMRSSREPRFELPDCAMIDGLRRLEIEEPPRLVGVELRLF